MKYRWDKKYLYWGVTAFAVIAASLCFALVLIRWDSVRGGLSSFAAIIRPVLYGAAIAYLLNPLMAFIERRLFSPICRPLQKRSPLAANILIRACGILFTMLLALLLLSLILSMLIPQLADSIDHIVSNMATYVSAVRGWITQLLVDNPELETVALRLWTDISERLTHWLQTDLLSTMSDLSLGLYSVIKTAMDMLIGIVISVYLLYNKERFSRQARKILFGALPLRTANSIMENVIEAHKLFGGFLIGKIIDSAIIGILCFIGVSLLRMPYTLLISVVIGVTNIIPFFGPFIGALPCACLILIVSPVKCLIFCLFIFALQQLDGNVIGPKILGSSTGLNSFWVLFAILLCGGLFGFAGMICGVPACAMVYNAVRTANRRALERKGLPLETEEYAGVHGFDPVTLQPLPLSEEALAAMAEAEPEQLTLDSQVSEELE